jgi:hypothetical protein
MRGKGIGEQSRRPGKGTYLGAVNGSTLLLALERIYYKNLKFCFLYIVATPQNLLSRIDLVNNVLGDLSTWQAIPLQHGVSR